MKGLILDYLIILCVAGVFDLPLGALIANELHGSFAEIMIVSWSTSIIVVVILFALKLRKVRER